MKNIHVLPTDKPSRLFLKENTLLLNNQYTLQEVFPKGKCHNIYITSNEEIKEGDWFYVKTPNIYGGNVAAKCLGFGENCWSEHILTDVADEKGYHPSHCVKIILTTDQNLIKDGLQAIDDEFLEWFVKNPSCEEVEVQCRYNFYAGQDLTHYKIIIPKEEPKQELPQLGTKEFNELASAYFGGKPKQETLEEARDAYNSSQERMYSEEDIINALHSVELKDNKDYSKIYCGMKEWFEKFKNK